MIFIDNQKFAIFGSSVDNFDRIYDFGLTNLFNTFFFTLGKASRMLAAKAALACRADALFESLEANNKDKDVKFDPEWIEQRERMNKGELGLEGRTKVETRIRILEGGHSLQVQRQFESFFLLKFIYSAKSSFYF